MKQEVPGPYACYDMTEPKPAPASKSTERRIKIQKETKT